MGGRDGRGDRPRQRPRRRIDPGAVEAILPERDQADRRLRLRPDAADRASGRRRGVPGDRSAVGRHADADPVTRTEQLKDWTPGTGTVWHTVEQSTYQADGRVRTTTDVRGNVTTTGYTPRVGGPVTSVTTTGPMPGWTSRRDLTPYWGSAVKIVDVNDRVTGELAYDPLGRTAKVWRLGWSRSGHESKPSSEYTYHFAAERDGYPYVRVTTLNATGNPVSSYQIVDGLLRPRQTQTPSAAGDGNRVVTDTIHDQYGRATVAYGPHVEPGAASETLWTEPQWSVPAVSRTDLDLAGRVEAEVFLSGDDRENLVEKWRTTTAHEGDILTTTPPAGGIATSTVTDIEGRTIALRQHTTTAGVAGAYQETRYRFDRKGNQVKVIDPAGNEWTSQFDARGRKTQATDPDHGITRTTYNDAGEVVTVTDARDEVLWYGYDRIGRKTETRDDSPAGALRAQWRYDTLYSGQAGFRGHLTESVRYEPAGSASAYRWQVRQFDARYQPTGINHVIPATLPAGDDKLSGTYVYSYGYAAPNGEPLTTTYPAGPAGSGLVTEQLTTGYDGATGLPVRVDTSLTGSAGTLATTSYTAYGEVNGSVRSVAGTPAVEDVIYRDEATRRISRTSAVGVTERGYTYDPAGNITELAEPDDRQCFRYDRLAQLTRAWTPKQGMTCAAEPAVADLGGPAPYWTDWTINSTGSRVTEVSHGTAGNTTRTYRVPAGGAGVTRPHALTEMTTAEPGKAPVTNKYAYDASGNTVCRPAGTAANDCDDGSGSQVLTWDAEGRVAAIAAAGKTEQANVYDADGARLIRRDSTGRTLYLPGQEIRQEGNTVTGTRYYSFAGGVIASRTGGSASANLTWLYTDHQGTQQTAVNAASHAVTVRRQTPYGGPRGPRSAWPTGKGFVGGDNDPTGLVHLGAREYDAVTGRFISVDPLMDMADPHQWNGYSYAGNSPVTRSDPDGLKPITDDQWFNTGMWDGSGASPGGGSSGGGSTVQNTNHAAADHAHDTRPPTNKQDAERRIPTPFLPSDHVSGRGKGYQNQIGGFQYTDGPDPVELARAADKYYARYYAETGDWYYANVLAIRAVCEKGEVQCGAALRDQLATEDNLLNNMRDPDCGKRCIDLSRQVGEYGDIVSDFGGVPHIPPIPCHSFDPDTPVLMADGSTKPIEDVKVGDAVLATDPATGRSASKVVTNTITGHGRKDLVEITVDLDGAKGAATATVTSTAGHPFLDREPACLDACGRSRAGRPGPDLLGGRGGDRRCPRIQRCPSGRQPHRRGYSHVLCDRRQQPGTRTQQRLRRAACLLPGKLHGQIAHKFSWR
ncbi:hypothetical protein I4J89_13990 [Actinoplanes sp. NEAU-A11]|uniref:Hint domain-containing protein n=1 Tax=Actinoplanes aureus TaxID=2792083 RepID=A0A931FXB4_9ACTN|nr:hypothetical protein [Actinoplanes aureus]